MKKIKILGIATMLTLVLIIIVIGVFAIFGFFKGKNDSESGKEISINKVNGDLSVYEWQTLETYGDITAIFKTEAGEIVIKLADCAAAEKFIELDNSGSFDNAEFLTLADDMFIQTGVYGEGFSSEKTGLAAINGAVGFVMEEDNAYPSIIFITAEKLSGESSSYMLAENFKSEKTALYKEFGGIPEYEEKIVIFGMVVSGSENIGYISEGENSGYAGGYSAAEPVKIKSIEISYPTEQN